MSQSPLEKKEKHLFLIWFWRIDLHVRLLELQMTIFKMINLLISTITIIKMLF